MITCSEDYSCTFHIWVFLDSHSSIPLPKAKAETPPQWIEDKNVIKVSILIVITSKMREKNHISVLIGYCNFLFLIYISIIKKFVVRYFNNSLLTSNTAKIKNIQVLFMDSFITSLFEITRCNLSSWAVIHLRFVTRPMTIFLFRVRTLIWNANVL